MPFQSVGVRPHAGQRPAFPGDAGSGSGENSADQSRPEPGMYWPVAMRLIS